MTSKIVANQKQKITEEQKEAAEQQIWDRKKSVNYDTLEYPVEVLVQKYMEGKDDDTNELFIPDYQRDLVWDEVRQSKFIESVFLGLPIPYIFVADVYDPENDLGRSEIVDGTQRIRTLASFINNELTLTELEKLEKLNGFTFADLPLARQRRFNRTTIRMIELTKDADDEVRRDLFERINTGSVELTDIEKLIGILPGKFTNLIEKLSKLPNFQDLCSFSDFAKSGKEPQEFVLRFFAFLNNYQNFKRNMYDFIYEYMENKNEDENLNVKAMENEFTKMLNFVNKHFPDGFMQGIKTKRTTTRIKFESLSVGVALALREKKASQLKPENLLLDSETFKDYTKSDGSSSKNKVTRRIEYVRDKLLGTEIKK